MPIIYAVLEQPKAGFLWLRCSNRAYAAAGFMAKVSLFNLQDTWIQKRRIGLT